MTGCELPVQCFFFVVLLFQVRESSFLLYLLENAFQVFTFCLPELDLDVGPWVETFQQGLSRVPFEHISDLMCPINDDLFDGVHETPVIRIISEEKRFKREGVIISKKKT